MTILRDIPVVRGKEIERQQKLRESKKPTPMEVRNVLPTGESEFLRPMPGSARMYPETDIPPIIITKDELSEADYRR